MKIAVSLSPPGTDHAPPRVVGLDPGDVELLLIERDLQWISGICLTLLGACVLVIAVLGWISPEPQTVDDPFEPHAVEIGGAR